MSNSYWRVSEEIDPVDGLIDLSELIGQAQIPQTIGLSYWVSTPGDGTAGGFSMNIIWEDIQGETRTEPGASFSLQDGAGHVRMPIGMFTRSAEDARFDLETDLSGLAGGAKIRYAFLISNGMAEGNIAR